MLEIGCGNMPFYIDDWKYGNTVRCLDAAYSDIQAAESKERKKESVFSVS
jgi:hypothetical protein